MPRGRTCVCLGPQPNQKFPVPVCPALVPCVHTPNGQELSQDELFDLVDAKVKTEVAGVDSGDGDNGKDRRNPRVGGGGGSGLKHALGPGGPEKNFGGDDAGEKEEDDVGVGAGGSEAALYVGNLGDSSGSDEDGNAVQASRRVRRRKKVKKNDTTAAAAQGGNSSSGGGGGGVGSASGAGAAAGHRDAGGGASGRDTGNKVSNRTPRFDLHPPPPKI